MQLKLKWEFYQFAHLQSGGMDLTPSSARSRGSTGWWGLGVSPRLHALLPLTRAPLQGGTSQSTGPAPPGSAQPSSQQAMAERAPLPSLVPGKSASTEFPWIGFGHEAIPDPVRPGGTVQCWPG